MQKDVVFSSQVLLGHIEKFKRAKRFKAQSTRNGYNSVLNLFAQYAEEDPWPPSADLVMDWLEEVGRTASAATVDSYWRHLRAFLNYCENTGVLNVEDNPVRTLKINGMTPDAPQMSPVSFTDLEISRLLDHLRKRAKSGLKSDVRVKRDYAIILFAYVTGCRAGEIVGLMMSDVDINKRQAFVRRQTSKAKFDRWVGFDDEVAMAILAWKMVRPETRCLNLFCSYGGQIGKGQPIKSTALNRMLYRHCGDAGVIHRKFHALRHSSALAAMDEGIPIHKVRDQMGHRSLKTTELYLRLRNKEQLEAYQESGLSGRLTGLLGDNDNQ